MEVTKLRMNLLWQHIKVPHHEDCFPRIVVHLSNLTQWILHTHCKFIKNQFATIILSDKFSTN